MVTLPKDFVAIKYPGYFWHLTEKRLYSVKIGGILRPLAKPSPPNYWNRGVSMYRLSVSGSHRYIAVEKLKLLKPKNSIIPVEKS